MITLPVFNASAALSVRGEQPKGYSPTSCLALANAGFSFEVFCADASAPSRRIFADGKDTGTKKHRFFARISSPEGSETLAAFSTDIQDALDADYNEGEETDEGFVWEPSIVLDGLNVMGENYHPNNEDGEEDETSISFRLRIVKRNTGAALLTKAAKSAIAH